jgi:alanyl-tRNA synthetase
MKSKEIRQEFLNFFKEKGHEIIKSASLVPKGDPTLLFTNAGMVQFKDYFLGKKTPPFSRAATSQKCLRAGGKQSDIQNVGYTARHHTFFEMLGNFSFGDYFKRDAIIMAWELFTERFKLPKERLWVTIFRDDDEAEVLWRENTSIAPDRIIRLGEKDNFWQMGDTGPCGPCSEIIFDQGADVGCGKSDCAVGCDCDRYLELWNLVFMQFERQLDGTLLPLPKPSIDTGMGLERITAALQGKKSNFDTDLFVPIIEIITSKSHIKYGSNSNTDSSIRIIADHIRSVTFMLTDGVIPSNEGRGYVLRKIIRRAVAHSRLIGIERPFFHTILDDFIRFFSDVYPEIRRERDTSYEFLRQEELGFFLTLDRALLRYQDMKERVIDNRFKGIDAFLLSDTFGMPREIIEDMTKRDGISVDWLRYETEMEGQRERSKKVVSEFSTISESSIYLKLIKQLGLSQFKGYNELETLSEITYLLKDGMTVNQLKQGQDGEIFLDKTPFYAESGGQSGDRGVIRSIDAEIDVLNTTKSAEGLFIHHIKIKKGEISVGDNVTCSVNRDIRNSTKRNHTATHLLQAALRNLFGSHIKQAGSSVSHERLRFDYTHFKHLEYDEKIRLQNLINVKIIENLSVNTTEMSIDEAMNSEATALFGEKYGDRVRVVEVNGHKFRSMELCGGTHCVNTGEIGTFIITYEGSIGSGLRRIEAVTGIKALEYVEKKIRDIELISDILNTENPVVLVESLNKRVRQLERDIEQTKAQAASSDISKILNTAVMINGARVIITRRDGLNIKQLREFSDHLRTAINSGVIFAASVLDGQASFISMVTKDLADKFNAGKIVQEASLIANGKGGGRPDMAQGGTKIIDKTQAAMDRALEIIKGSIQ